MEKVIRDGKVAVLISPGFGAGWSTWNPDYQDLFLFHPKLVEMVEAGKRDQLTEEWFDKEFPGVEAYCGGADDLTIKWLPQGTHFTVQEYDGSESLLFLDDIRHIA